MWPFEADVISDARVQRGPRIILTRIYLFVIQRVVTGAILSSLQSDGWVSMQDQREKELLSFKKHFDDVTFKKGTDLRLALSSDGSVTTMIDGTKKGTITSKPLSKALVDVYLGKDPPSPALKSDFLSTAAALLT